MANALPPEMRHYSHFTPESTPSRSQSTLDLELGESSIWDEGNRDSEHDDEWYDEARGSDPDPSQTNSDLHKQNASDTQSRSVLHEPRRRRSAVDLLIHFDPQNPPVTDDPDELQLWLECEAQQESVLRYQRVIDSARSRKDYSSMPLVQQQVLRWFQPLKDDIESRQKEYMLKTGKRRKAVKRYGPFLCSLPPEKLAVIVSHEAIMHALLRSGLHGKNGVTFVSMAKRIGEAVEEEVLIHRMLHRRFKESQAQRLESDVLIEVEELVSTESGDSDTRLLSDAEEEDSDVEPFDNVTHSWAYAASHLKAYMDEITKQKPTTKKRRAAAYAVRRARRVIDDDERWTIADKIQVGAALFQSLLTKATLVNEGKEEMAFTYEKRWVRGNRLKSLVQINDKLYKMFVSDRLQSFGATTTRPKPMVRPPLPWRAEGEGGYLWLRADLLRRHGCNTQKEALANADLTTVLDGLNALGRVPWKINRRVLEVAQKCWDDDIPLGDIPTQTDFVEPPEPIQPEQEKFLEKEDPGYEEMVVQHRKYKEARMKFDRVRQRNMDLRSLRCSAMLKLDQAEKFQEFGELYLPYSMDFRGRAYPIPPHLSNVGSDLCRGMLMFSEAKPLGQRGLFWLKVHLANFAGQDKMSFEDRAAFVDDNMEHVRQSAESPFEGDRWWMELEDPFQGLATCIEIIQAIDSGDPESYECSLPVHMDGSCNGLQHYAALGRDVVGGKAVNLIASEEPQDVYVGVMEEVVRRVAEEAERSLAFETSDLEALSKKEKKALNDNRAAKLVNGLIDRGVVKRTVMTSVYGVTYVGARQQIQEKIEEKLEAQGYDVDDIGYEVFQACGYLARVTMDVMGDLFSGAKETMNWLTTCARLISQHGYPVAWISPIGLPAIQPYRQKKSATLVTLLQTVTLTQADDDLPIHKHRQVTAFPPNYVHSLDSSHMLLTALEMDRRGLTFSAVHDSFWTHACDIDEMNVALRDVFVELYEQPLLERLKETWEMRYPDLEFPDVPERGELDLNDVKQAKYFFQ